MEPASEPAVTPGAAGRVLEMARRLGPLPYSAGDPRPGPVPALPDAMTLVSWQVDAVDTWWAEFGRPDPFTLVEVGAGDGTRAQAYLAAGPECLTALRYVLVDDDPGHREQQRAHLPIESPILVLGPVGPDQEEDDDEQHGRAVEGIGPLITSLGEPPVVDGTAVVLVIGWVSRLPSDRLEWRHGSWWEIRLAAPRQAGTGAAAGTSYAPDSHPDPHRDEVLTELPVPLDPERARFADQLTGPPPRPEGARYAVLGPAVDWLTHTLRVAGTGRLVIVDRWTEVTGPLAPGQVPPLDLSQLTTARRPIERAPVTLFPELSMVSWRLG